MTKSGKVPNGSPASKHRTRRSRKTTPIPEVTWEPAPATCASARGLGVVTSSHPLTTAKMVLTHRKNRKEQDDPEKGDPEGEDSKAKQAEEDRYTKGDEYEILLRFVADEAEKEKKKKASGGDEEEEEVKKKRVWYMPWKQVEVKSEKDKKVPEDWLKTDVTKGLSSSDIEGRRKDYGFNELSSPSENQILKFISYFRGPILYAMELAVILAAGLEDWIDFGVIIGILMMNAGVGWYQEKQAGVVAQLKAGIALKATVVRDGKESEIEARELVIGDVIVLEEGTTIPADAKIIADYDAKDGSKAKELVEKHDQHSDQGSDATKGNNDKGSDNKKGDTKKDYHENHDEHDDEEEDKGPSVISVDQSAITGESLAVDKFFGETAYYTCGVKRGKAYGVVACPAKSSFVGKTAALVLSSNEQGHFQIVLGGIGTTLLVLVLFFLFIVWSGGIYYGVAIATPIDNSLLLYTLIYLIIGVPVGLPCVTTTTMAVGAAYLARHKCIVQKLTAIESLAGVDILCSDKTGTLTANKLSLNEPYLAEGVDRDWFMTVAALASSHNIKTLDPIDKVTLLALKDYPGAQENLKTGWKTKNFKPFDPVSKRITAEVEKDGKKYTMCKGAPNAILKLRTFDKEVALSYRAKAQEFATRGFRSLGVALKEDGKDWELLGIMSMSDPPRSDTAKTIQTAKELGIGIKILTGDSTAIGKELAKQLSLGTKIFDSEKLMAGGLAGADLRDFVEAADGFAEVFPEHKYAVVEMLQQRGHLVAMTGDGVNDAPSLKKADCGIAVEGASDAARSAAAVVFLDEGLNSIITSIKVARQIFARMKAYIIYRIALCIHLEVYLMFTILIIKETIRVDLIVFLAVFADLATLAIAYDNAAHAQKPVEWQLGKVWIMSTITGLILAGGTWLLRGTMILYPNGGIIQHFGSVQEVIFLEVALTESWIILITRLKQTIDEELTWPSWQLVGAILGVDILASFFCLFGWLSGTGYNEPAFRSGDTSIVTVIRIWCFSFGVVVIAGLVYLLLNKMTWLDNLGKKTKSKKDEALENFLTEMQRMTLKHEHDASGEDFYRFAPGGGADEVGDAGSKSDQKKEVQSKGKEGSKSQNGKTKKDAGKQKEDQSQGRDEKKHSEDGSESQDEKKEGGEEQQADTEEEAKDQ